MTWKTALIIMVVILFLGIVGAAIYKIVSASESQKAKEIINHTSEPHFGLLSFGCASYKVMQAQAEIEKVPIKLPVKK